MTESGGEGVTFSKHGKYWMEFDNFIASSPITYPKPSSPDDRSRAFVRWSGFPFGFQLTAHGPRHQRSSNKEMMSVELIKDGGTSTSISDEVLGQLDQLRWLYGGDLKIVDSGAGQFKLDESTEASLTDETDWRRQHLWLLSRVMRLHCVFGPFLADLKSRG